MTAKPQYGLPTAAIDLGLGGLLKDQLTTETEEERKKKRLGLGNGGKSAASDQLFGFTDYKTGSDIRGY